MKVHIILSFLSMLLLYSCEKNNRPIDFYLSEIENKLTNEEISELKEKREIELVKYIKSQFSIRMFEDSVHIEYGHALDTLLEDEGIIDEKYKFPAIYMAIHYKLNNLEIPYNNINNTIESYYNRQYEEEIEIYKKMSESAKINYDRFAINDTICLLFPLEATDEGNNVLMYEADYYDDGSIFGGDVVLPLEWKDTLIIKGVLLEKDKEKFNFEFPIFGYSFYLKIFSLNKSGNLNSVAGNLEIGDTIGLYLNQYLRKIESCNPRSREYKK